MNVFPGYLAMEKISFAYQLLPIGEPEASLDGLVLKEQERKEIEYIAMVAEHSVDYGGAGTAEYFFPIETGQFESSAGPGMETDWESN
jgi:hypothetical protein